MATFWWGHQTKIFCKIYKPIPLTQENQKERGPQINHKTEEKQKELYIKTLKHTQIYRFRIKPIDVLLITTLEHLKFKFLTNNVA